MPVFPVFSFLTASAGLHSLHLLAAELMVAWVSRVPHGKVEPQVYLMGCPDGVASAEAPDGHLRAQTAAESQGAPPCIHCSCVMRLHQLRFLLKPLRSEEAFTSTLASSWA